MQLEPRTSLGRLTFAANLILGVFGLLTLDANLLSGKLRTILSAVGLLRTTTNGGITISWGNVRYETWSVIAMLAATTLLIYLYSRRPDSIMRFLKLPLRIARNAARSTTTMKAWYSYPLQIAVFTASLLASIILLAADLLLLSIPLNGLSGLANILVRFVDATTVTIAAFGLFFTSVLGSLVLAKRSTN